MRSYHVCGVFDGNISHGGKSICGLEVCGNGWVGSVLMQDLYDQLFALSIAVAGMKLQCLA